MTFSIVESTCGQQQGAVLAGLRAWGFSRQTAGALSDRDQGGAT
jgi:hypothetical protein